jgi:Protein of unknown function (DUF1353)
VPFQSALVAEITEDRAVLREPLVYQGQRDRFVIPAGFRTDFASVPRWATPVVPRMGVHTRAAIVHDYLCALLRGDRAWPDGLALTASDADGIFRRIMREEGTSLQRRWVAWAAVRVGALGDDWHRGDWDEWLGDLPGVLAVAVPVLGAAAAPAGAVYWTGYASGRSARRRG